MPNRGLDALGYIEREGSSGLIQRAFRPVVAVARDRVPEVFGAAVVRRRPRAVALREYARVHGIKGPRP